MAAAVRWRKRRFRDGENGSRDMAKTTTAGWRERRLRDGESG